MTQARDTTFVHPLRLFCDAAARSASWRRSVLAGLCLVALLAVCLRLADAGLGGLFDGAGSKAARLSQLAVFLAVWPALWITLRVVLRRDPRTLFGPAGRVNWAHFRVGLAVALCLGAAAWLPYLRATGGVAVDPLTWALLAIVALPLIFVQATAEELIFRGYLLQEAGARTFNALAWSLAPSLIFAWLHDGWGPFGLSWFHLLMGVALAAVTVRTANLGAAMGLHVGHNLVNILLVSSAGAERSLALAPLPAGGAPLWPSLAYIAMITLAAAIFMLRADLGFLSAWRAANRRAEAA